MGREVHAGEGDRHVRLVAECRGGAHHRDGARVPRLELARDVAFDGREHEIDAAGIELRGILDRQREHVRRGLLAAPPAPRAVGVADRFPVRASGGARGGGEQRDVEPGMVGERDQELLAGDAGGSNDRDATLAHGTSGVSVLARSSSTAGRPRS